MQIALYPINIYDRLYHKKPNCQYIFKKNLSKLQKNNDIFIKARIDSKLSEVLKIILNKMNMTQQEFFDKKIKEFIIENINLVVSVYDNKSYKK